MSIDQLAEQVEAWRDEIAEMHCGSCRQTTCCDTNLHVIPVEEEALDLFRENGVPVYAIDKLDLKSLVQWWRTPRKYNILDNEGNPIEKPALVQTPGTVDQDKWVMYSDSYCPLYSKATNRCTVHDDPRRPEACKEFPVIIFREPNTGERALQTGYTGNEVLAVEFKKACNIIHHPAVRADFERRFDHPAITIYAT